MVAGDTIHVGNCVGKQLGTTLESHSRHIYETSVISTYPAEGTCNNPSRKEDGDALLQFMAFVVH